MASLRVLCIDDEYATRNVVDQALSIFGHTVILAEDGQSGIDAFKEHKPQVVLVDRSMPNMDGDDVAAEIKKIDGSVPIIMLTGDGTAMLRSDEKPDHVDMILGKPLSIKELCDGVEKAVAEAG